MQARLYAKGQKVVNPDPRLALFIDCTRWNCLPNAGGWYDQDPEICESFGIIEMEMIRVKNEKIKQEAQKNRRG